MYEYWMLDTGYWMLEGKLLMKLRLPETVKR
jgi:hypothetical protein